jgi:pectinesterase
MADKDIYLVPTTNVLQFGRRVYYFNCHKDGGDYGWFKNNLNTAPGTPKANDINADWVFGNKWHPGKNKEL